MLRMPMLDSVRLPQGAAYLAVGALAAGLVLLGMGVQAQLRKLEKRVGAVYATSRSPADCGDALQPGPGTLRSFGVHIDAAACRMAASVVAGLDTRPRVTESVPAVCGGGLSPEINTVPATYTRVWWLVLRPGPAADALYEACLQGRVRHAFIAGSIVRIMAADAVDGDTVEAAAAAVTANLPTSQRQHVFLVADVSDLSALVDRCVTEAQPPFPTTPDGFSNIMQGVQSASADGGIVTLLHVWAF